MMNKDFITRADTKKNEYLLKTEDLFVINKDKWFADFAKHFRDICAQIQKQQIESALSAISYLEYTMLYTNLINRKYDADIFVYSDKHYLNKSQRFVGSYDISSILVYYDKLWNELTAMKKFYVGKVTAHDVTRFMLKALSDFYSYLVNIARFVIAECIDESPFINIDKNEKFMVNIGDYMSITEPVYVEEKNKDANTLAKWFSDRHSNEYAFGDYSNLDFSCIAFTYTDFRYARFRNSTLKRTDFSGSSLIGTNFSKASMERCRMNHCSISEADFSYAKLNNACFKKALGKAGLSDKKKWEFAGFLPVSFRNADLTNTDFTKADLTGADFTGAIINGTNFSGANLDNAIFD